MEYIVDVPFYFISEDTLEDVLVEESYYDTVPTAADTDIVENLQTNTSDSVQTGKDNSIDSDADDQDYFEYHGPDDEDDDDDELDYVISSEITKKKNSNINIKSVLKLLDRDVDIIEMSRILVCQILQYHSNSKARTAIQNGDFIDLSVTGIN